MKYICSNCGYIYDEAIGHPDNGIGPGTIFEDIPDSWVCPVCYVPKDKFDLFDQNQQYLIKFKTYNMILL